MSDDRPSPHRFKHYLPDELSGEVELWIEDATDVAMLRATSGGKDPVELAPHELRHIADRLNACADEMDRRDARGDASRGR